MDKKAKEELGEFFAESFRDVVLPELESIRNEMATKKDVENMATKSDIDRLERKIEASYSRADRQDKKITNHEKRIKKVETRLGKISAASI